MLKSFSAWNGAPCALLLGGFDGFHNGHRTLLHAARSAGLPVGLTSISGNKAGGDVFTFAERETIFRREGFDFAVELQFCDIRDISAEAFLSALSSQIEIEEIYCGKDFRFGKGATGTPELLQWIAPCPVHVLPLQEDGGEKLAVSRIKRLLTDGEVSKLSRLLGYDYFIQGEVEHGREVGRTYGFPTINLRFPQGKYPPKEGVYGGTVETSQGNYPAIVHFGARPTFGVTEWKVEAYLDGFSGKLYGETVRVCPKEFYRPVEKFDGADALKNQLERDRERLKGGIRE